MHYIRRRFSTASIVMRGSAYAQNGFQPFPTDKAPHDVTVNFAFARGVLPATSPVSSLLVSGRGYRSFSGSPSNFVEHVQNGPAVVFFYKPACGPCAAIRKKLISSVGEGFHILKEKGMHTEEVKPKEVEEETANGIHAVTGADNNSNDFTVALAQMSEEDQKVCLDLRDTITSKIDASPDRLCFITVNTDENARLTALHDVRSLPTFVTYHRGRIVGRVEGAKQEKVLELILQLLKVDDGSEEQPKPFSEEQ